jgi:GABA(A) receptor-associated protein
MGIPYKTQYSFEQRFAEAQKVRQKFPGRYPFIIERANVARMTIPEVDKKKYLVPGDITMGQFIGIIRRNMQVRPEIAIFFFINGSLPTTGELMKELYSRHVDKDGFAYMQYAGESTFGN